MYDIAPQFRKLIAVLPIEALEEMEKELQISDSKAVKLALADIEKEKANRQ